jgi:hypothetical protein
MRDVLLEQLRATGFTLRVPLLLAAALAVLFLIAIVPEIVGEGQAANFHSQPSALFGLVGLLVPIAVWAREERFGPGFLWTLPVDRRQHALTKALAGWLWLMGGVALFVLGQLLLTIVSGGRVLPEEMLHVFIVPGASRSQLDPAALRMVRWTPGVLIWAVPFVAATATYLFASAFMLGVRRPLLWLAGAVLLVPLSSVATHAAGRALDSEWLADAPSRAVESLAKGRFGLDALLTARTALLDDRAILTTGERILVWSAMPEIGDWGIAALLWTGAGLLALWAAASRHRERRRA